VYDVLRRFYLVCRFRTGTETQTNCISTEMRKRNVTNLKVGHSGAPKQQLLGHGDIYF